MEFSATSFPQTAQPMRWRRVGNDTLKHKLNRLSERD